MPNYIEINNLGSFASIAALWAAHPEGGTEGDYCTIDGVKYHWNKYDRMWMVDPNYGPTPARKVETFDGNVNIQNNLTVAGYIRAKGIKQPCLGLFLTYAALTARWPEPEVGSWALVGDDLPAELYVYDATDGWKDTGNTVDIDDVDLSSITINGIKHYVPITSTNELPSSPTEEQQGFGYLLNGTTLYIYVGTGGDTLDGKYQSAQLKGDIGKSAYQIYVDTTTDDPVKTEEEWLASLKGADGEDGATGSDGKSAYQSYYDTTSDSPKLTEAEWVASLHGADGVDLGQVAIADNCTTDDATKVLSAKQGKKLKDELDAETSEIKAPFEKEYLLCGDIGYYNYGDKYLSCNAADVFETDVYIEKIRYNKSILDSITSTREAKTIRYAIVNSSYKITSIHSSTLAADGYEISVGLVLPAGSRLAFVSETLGTDSSNRTVRSLGYKKNQGTGALHYTYVNQYQVGSYLSLTGTDKITGFEVIAKKYDPTIINGASDVPYTDKVGQGYDDVQEILETLQNDNNVYKTLFINETSSTTSSSGVVMSYYRVTDRYVWDEAKTVYRIEFDRRVLDTVVDREDVTVTWIVANASYAISQLGTATLKADKYYIDVAINVPAGHHIGLKNFVAGQDLNSNNVYGVTVISSSSASNTSHYAYDLSSTEIGTQMNAEKNEMRNVRFYVIESLHDEVMRQGENIDELQAVSGRNKVEVSDATNCLLLGSSLTDDYHSPKGLGWCQRLNDLVDINVLNGGWTGTSITSNIQKTIFGNISHDYTTDSLYRKIPYKVDYLWWGNTANGTPVGQDGTALLLEAKKVTDALGAKMLIGTENPMTYSGRSFDRHRKEFGFKHNIPVSAHSYIASKLKVDSPYAGFSSGVHGGYRTNAFFLAHYDLMSRLPIEKNVKLFKVRPDYQSGSPTVAQLVYENNEERFKYFTAIAAGCGAYVTTGAADNRDSSSYNVESSSAPTLAQEEFALLKGSAITFNKYCLAEFILDRIHITKATFSATLSAEPSNVYIATKKQSYSSGCTEWVELTDKSFSNGVLTVNISNKTREIEWYDKVKILIYYSSGDFTVNNPCLSDYDGIKKVPIDALDGYHHRQYGEELNPKTSCESGWTLNGNSAVKSLPTEIANYSGYNNVKSHIELPADTDTVTKAITLSSPVSKVAVRVVANLFPKIATNRTWSSMTSAEQEEYISSTPTVVESGYNFGTLKLDVKARYSYYVNGVLTYSDLYGLASEKFLMQPGWQEFYTEIDVLGDESELTLTIGRANTVSGYTTNSDFKVLIHDVSVQKIG